jgi:hypothetical protein
MAYQDPEFASIDIFAQYLKDEERTTFTVQELNAVNYQTRLMRDEIRQALDFLGFTLEPQAEAVKRVRGFQSNSNDRWSGPGSEKTHGGSGFR